MIIHVFSFKYYYKNTLLIIPGIAPYIKNHGEQTKKWSWFLYD